MKSEQIQKLLALSKSDNPNEAAVALKKAQELMDKYGYQEWQQLLNSYKFDLDISPLIRTVEKVSHDYVDNEAYQKGLVDGIRCTLAYLFDEEEPEYAELDAEEYDKGFAVGNDVSGDFFEGIDVEKEKYKV